MDSVSGGTIDYTYDSLNRLITSATQGPQWGLSFSYDGFGNRLSQTVTKGSGPSNTLSVNAATNRISSSGYYYDSNGNLTTMPYGTGAMTLSYDIENRQIQAANTNGTERYVYGPDNRRVYQKTASGTELVFFYGINGDQLRTYTLFTSNQFQVAKTNIYFAGRLIWGDNTTVHLDRLGSVRNTSRYYPFGEEQGSGTIPDKFATYYRDTSTGLDYAMNRYYGSTMGRFTTPDPYGGSPTLTRPNSWNRYAYVENDPVGHVDPSGLNLALYLDGGYAGDYSGDGSGFGGSGGGGYTDPTNWTAPWSNSDYASSAGEFFLTFLIGNPLGRTVTRSFDPCDRSIPLNAQKLDWIAAHRKDADKVAKELGVSTAEILGLSALESTWGNNRFAKEGNNFFSLHYPASLATGFILARADSKVKVATFASYADSAESFRLDYGSIVKGISDPTKFAAALQNAGKYGINPDGSKVASFVGSTAATIRGLASRLECE